MSASDDNPKMDLTAWIMLVALGLIWGGSFLFSRIAVLEIPPITLVLARVALAALALNAFLMFRQNDFIHTKKLWRDFTFMGIVNNIIPFSLIFYGQTEIGAGLAAIVNAMTPISTLIMAHFMTENERLSINKVVGIFLAILGVIILIGGSALSGFSGSVLAQLSVLAATISYGLAGVFGRRFAGVPPMQTARGQLTASSLIILPIALVVDQPWSLPLPSAGAIWSVVALALLCTAVAYILFFRILASSGAVNVSLTTLLIPPFAIILGIIVLGETLELRQLIGMIVIMAGLIAIDGRIVSRK